MMDQANGTAGRVLLIEDDAGIRRILARHLERTGYEVTALSSARTVFGRGGVAPYDIVVSDVHLPGMGGIELAGRLLSERPSQPIVLITGDPDEVLAREALARGPVSYLLKPFELFELDAAMRQAQRARLNGAELRAAVAEPSGGGRVPESWLAQFDATSAGGAGHGVRVGLLAVRLARCLPASAELATAHLEQAARHHEVGRIAGPTAAPTELAARSASVLSSLGFADIVVRAVRHMHERWDGGGEPGALRGWQIPAAAQALAVADAADHYAGAWLRAGARDVDAVDRAIRLVLVQQETVFNPQVAVMLQREREFVQRTCLRRENSATEATEDVPAGVENDRVGHAHPNQIQERHDYSE